MREDRVRPLLLRGGRLVDPSQNLDCQGDLLLVDGKVAGLWPGGREERPGDGDSVAGAQLLPVEGMTVSPGFVDWHCHLRQPGYEHKETIASGSLAAARGGFTTICCMPNTRPVIDDWSVVQQVRQAESSVRLLPIAAVSKGQEGRELTQMAELAAAGVAGFSDDGRPVETSRLMRSALEYARMLGLPVIDHCEDVSLSKGGDMNEGPVCSRLGLKGNPAAAEDILVARDLALAELTGGWLHVAHVSSAGAVQLIRMAKSRGVRVTAEACPHHLTLSDQWVAGVVSDGGPAGLLPPSGRAPYDTNTKVAPPLRSLHDVECLLEGLLDGTIDIIATDHAPHAWEDKACEFGLAASGISGFETALGALLGLVHGGRISLGDLVDRLACSPGRMLSRAGGDTGIELAPKGVGTLAVGAPADVVVFDPLQEWTVDPNGFASKGKNSPLAGVRLRGRVQATVFGGRLVYGGSGNG